jgi:hypothetical protein
MSRSNAKLRVAFLSLLFLLLLGCSKRIRREEVVGRYVAHHGKGVDIIEVIQDGTFKQVCRLTGEPESTNTGRWNISYFEDELRIAFDGFVFCLPEYRNRKRGSYDPSVQQSWRRTLRLPLDIDLNYYYEKQQ